VLRRDSPRLKWCGIALLGITAMQWAEGFLWLDGPRPGGALNHWLTVALIPMALLSQAWGPLLGSLWAVPLRGRRLPFFVLLAAGLAMVVAARVIYHPAETQVTPQGHLNWWSAGNPPVYVPWAYALWAAVIGAPFLLWWRPLWQAGLIVSWGWLCALASYFVADNPASYWCFFITYYTAFTLLLAFTEKDAAPARRG
jgi:hypothetical protein